VVSDDVMTFLKKEITGRSRLLNIVREQLLRALFPLVAVWSLLILFSEGIDRLQRTNPFPEGGGSHHLFEAAVWPLAALLVLAAAGWLLRRRPEFLRLLPSAPLTVTGVRTLVHGTVLFVAVTVGTVAISYLFYDPATDPQGQFHIWVWAGGFLYAAALAPTAALFTVWRTSSRKGRAE
jgi:hypothetical protein